MQSGEPIIEQWKADWITRQMRMSQHPLQFWRQIVDLLIEGRLTLNNNPLAAIGRYALDWPGALELLIDRNNRGITLEKKGQVDAAIVIYELSIADEFFGTHPYDRLRIIYGKRQWYEDAIRACQAYISLPKRSVGQNKPHFQHHLEKLRIKQKAHTVKKHNSRA